MPDVCRHESTRRILTAPWGTLDVDGSVAETAITYGLYASGFLRYVPVAIGELRRRNAAFLDVFLGRAIGEGSSGGFYYAAHCFELPPPLSPDAVQSLRNRYPWSGRADRFAPDPERVCAAFVAPSGDHTVFEPVRSDVPTLIFAGEFDPTTPPEYGRRVAATLPNSHLVVLTAKGHDVNAPTPCTVQMRQAFLDDPMQPPDRGCLSAQAGCCRSCTNSSRASRIT